MHSLTPVLEVLPGACVVTYLNQTDVASEAMLPEHAQVLRSSTGHLTPIGVGYSILADAASDARWWLHIEDDWQAFQVDTTLACLREAANILEYHSDIVQVRLRYYKERVMQRHMVSGQPIRWQRRERFDVAAAHWTFNPAMQRGSVAAAFSVPLQGEDDAQRRVDGLVAQVFPGAFIHLGNHDSLRRR